MRSAREPRKSASSACRSAAALCTGVADSSSTRRAARERRESRISTRERIAGVMRFVHDDERRTPRVERSRRLSDSNETKSRLQPRDACERAAPHGRERRRRDDENRCRIARRRRAPCTSFRVRRRRRAGRRRNARSPARSRPLRRADGRAAQSPRCAVGRVDRRSGSAAMRRSNAAQGSAQRHVVIGCSSRGVRRTCRWPQAVRAHDDLEQARRRSADCPAMRSLRDRRRADRARAPTVGAAEAATASSRDTGDSRRAPARRAPPSQARASGGVQNRGECERVARVRASHRVAGIERDRGVARQEHRRASSVRAEVGPHDARDVVRRGLGAKQRPPPCRCRARRRAQCRRRRQPRSHRSARGGRRSSGSPSAPCVQMTRSPFALTRHRVTCSPRMSGRSSSGSTSTACPPSAADDALPSRVCTMNAPLHPHFTPSSGAPNRDAPNGVPAARTASNARARGRRQHEPRRARRVVEPELAGVPRST